MDRGYWSQSRSDDFDDVALIWTQWKTDIVTDLPKLSEATPETPVRLYGKMEGNAALSNKKNLFSNL